VRLFSSLHSAALLDGSSHDYSGSFREVLDANALVRSLNASGEAAHLGISPQAALAQMAAMRAVRPFKGGVERRGTNEIKNNDCCKKKRSVPPFSPSPPPTDTIPCSYFLSCSSSNLSFHL
jgi:hypothetical protein